MTSIFFELINLPASEADIYNFGSVELKQTAFRIDGVFLPTNNQKEQPIYFVEVQFQKDKEKEVTALAITLLSKARSDLPDERLQKNLLDLIQTIVSYKLPRLSPQELARIFSISDLINTRYYQEVRYEEALNYTMRIIERRIGGVSQDLQVKINQLSVENLENLGLALLDFTSMNDLVIWLNNQASSDG
ncbi:DUF2887 domain-containing protein [Okeanomitos corallinicola TIOX110]|uniref:DUF2887 domain-containing protein n=1 Tax=Okeanomitos corallinicola TIOX110 TaxID=3133117 RepID=A0ABZ2UQG8_9CYAN